MSNIAGTGANIWLLHLIRTHAAGPLPDELIEIVARVATADPAPSLLRPDDGIDLAAANSSHGAAARTIGALLAEDPKRIRLLESALRELATDPHVEVRAAVASAVSPLLQIDPDLALTIFHKAVNDLVGKPLSGESVQRFLRTAVHLGQHHRVADVLKRMLTDPEASTREAAARWRTLAAYYDESLDRDIDALLASQDSATRAAVIDVFAANITGAPRRDRSIAVVSAAFHDPDEAVRNAAARSIYSLKEQPLIDYSTLIAAFADSPTLTEESLAVLLMIESSRRPLPTTILDLCEKIIAANDQDIEGGISRAASDATRVTRIALRIHAQQNDPEVRRRCLDLIDRLIAVGAHNVESDLDTIER